MCGKRPPLAVDNSKFVLRTSLVYLVVCDDCVRVLLDDDGNINPYATFPFNRPAGSPPARLTSHAATDPQSRPSMSHAADNAAATTQHTRLGTVCSVHTLIAFNSRVTFTQVDITLYTTIRTLVVKKAFLIKKIHRSGSLGR